MYQYLTTVWYVRAGVFNLFSIAPIMFSSQVPFADIWQYPTVNVEYDGFYVLPKRKSGVINYFKHCYLNGMYIMRPISEHGKYATYYGFIVVFSEVKTILITYILFSNQETLFAHWKKWGKIYLPEDQGIHALATLKPRCDDRLFEYSNIRRYRMLYAAVASKARISCYVFLRGAV